MIHTTVNGIHALKLTRPSTEPNARIGVIAANTNWKYANAACGNGNVSAFPYPPGTTPSWVRALALSSGLGVPMNPCKNPSLAGWAPELNHGLPKPILNAYSTQMIITTEKVPNVSIMLLIDQRFCMTPPYRTTRPGTLISPTNVAAVICQAVLPVSNQ